MSSEKQMKRLRKIVYNNAAQRNTQYGMEGNSIVALGNRRKYQDLKKKFKSLSKNEKHKFLIKLGVNNG